MHVEVNSAQYDAHFLFTRRLASGQLVSEDCYSPSLRFYHAEDGFECGGLACAVAAYQTHYAPLAEGEGDVLEREAGIALRQPFNGQNIHLLCPSCMRPPEAEPC